MSSTREVAERLFDEPLPDNARYADFDIREWHVSRIDAALRQREQEVRAEERERIARMLGNGSDGVGGDWEASEAAVAVGKGTHEN